MTGREQIVWGQTPNLDLRKNAYESPGRSRVTFVNVTVDFLKFLYHNLCFLEGDGYLEAVYLRKKLISFLNLFLQAQVLLGPRKKGILSYHEVGAWQQRRSYHNSGTRKELWKNRKVCSMSSSTNITHFTSSKGVDFHWPVGCQCRLLLVRSSYHAEKSSLDLRLPSTSHGCVF